jgi:hypothetical protein
MVQACSRLHGFNPTSVNVGFVVDKAALEQAVFLKYFGFPLSVSIHHCSILIHASPTL